VEHIALKEEMHGTFLYGGERGDVDTSRAVRDSNYREADIGFVPRWMAALSLPCRDEPGRTRWTRCSEDGVLVIQSGIDATGHVTAGTSGRRAPELRFVGIPYGSIPRLILVWMTTEALRTQSREIALGRTSGQLLRKLGIRCVSGGVNGTVTTVKRQLHRLINSQIRVRSKCGQDVSFSLISETNYSVARWATRTTSTDRRLLEPRITLSESFYQSLREGVIQVDLGSLHSLTHSPLAMDLYCLSKLRTEELRRSESDAVEMSWASLQEQMGSQSRRSKFVENVSRLLPRVNSVIRGLGVTAVAVADGLRIVQGPAASEEALAETALTI